MNTVLRAGISIALTLTALAIAWSFITPQAWVWYDTLAKPPFTPPDWMFLPIWIGMYLLMALAFVRICEFPIDPRCRRWFSVFLMQLLFNILWSVLFFFFHSLSLTLVVAIILWFAIIILATNSWEIDRLSFWLLLPYVVWMTYATVMTTYLWWMN